MDSSKEAMSEGSSRDSEICMTLWLLAGQINLLEKLMMKKHFINASLAMKNNATINSCCDRVLFPLIFCWEERSTLLHQRLIE